MTYFIVAYVYTWWRGDELPALSPLADFRCERSDEVQLLARLHELEIEEMARRLETGHKAYIASIQDEPVGYGWTASKTVGVIEAGLEWPLTPSDRALWDFVTLEGWRGRGIYPRLLQAILRLEAAEAERFWIGHRADNAASKRGIIKAGFQLSDIVVLTSDYQPRSVPRGDRERALADPQGKHFGFVDVADEDMIIFDFENMEHNPPVQLS